MSTHDIAPVETEVSASPPRRPPAGVSVRLKDPSKARVERCSSCGTLIAVQAPTPASPATAWLCKTCGAIYFGGDHDGGAADCLGVDRAVLSQCNPFIAEVTVVADVTSGSAPQHVIRLVHALGGELYAGPERRKDKRYAVAVPVVAVPLGPDFRIDGEPVQMTTLNVSLGGAALLHTRFVEVPYYALDFTIAGVELLQVIMQVLRVRNIGPAYEIGGRFISRLSQKV